MTTNTFGIVVAPIAPHSSPPPSTAGATTQCAYSEPINPRSSAPTYRCYTLEEWNAKQAAIAQQQAQLAANTQGFLDDHGMQIVYGFAIFMALVIVISIYQKRKHRNDQKIRLETPYWRY